ncbi:hypothetical protein L0Y69_02470 [bacterium]|nr:hypothetical protein [bacterium]
MITDADITKLKKTFVTKEGLKTALKKELSNYPTKADLKKELSNYPTKDDLKKSQESLIDRMFSIFATKEDVRKSGEDTVQAIQNTLQEYLNKSDKDAQKIDILESEYAAHGFQLDRHERWIGALAGKAGVALKQD